MSETVSCVLLKHYDKGWHWTIWNKIWFKIYRIIWISSFHWVINFGWNLINFIIETQLLDTIQIDFNEKENRYFRVCVSTVYSWFISVRHFVGRGKHRPKLSVFLNSCYATFSFMELNPVSTILFRNRPLRTMYPNSMFCQYLPYIQNHDPQKCMYLWWYSVKIFIFELELIVKLLIAWCLELLGVTSGVLIDNNCLATQLFS